MTSIEFNLPGVVPWGRTAAEYEQFFALDHLPPGSRLLDCGGGPSSFVVEYATRGHHTFALDPLYQWPINVIRDQFEATVGPMMEGMRRADYRFVWRYYQSPEHVLTFRKAALKRTLAEMGRRSQGATFIAGALPRLPFIANAFDLAVCSHLLFLYSDELSLAFHEAAVVELLRVAKEVQVFPLLELSGKPSRHLDVITDRLSDRCDFEIETIDFEFQRGGNRRLRVRTHRL